MKNSIWKYAGLAGLAVVAAASPATAATVSATYNYQVGTNAGTYYDGDITTIGDLLYDAPGTTNTYSGSSPSSHPNGNPYAGPITTLFDGASSGAGDIGDSNAYYPGFLQPATITVDLGGSATGYNISSLTAIGGWNNEQQGSIAFDLQYQVVGQTGFTDLGTFANDVPFSSDQYNHNDANGNFVHGLADGTETDLAFTGLTGVTALQFTIVSSGTSASVYHEIEAFGSATPVETPEPSTYALMLAGLAVLGFGLRRKAVRLG